MPKSPDAKSHRELCVMAGLWLRRQGCTVTLVDPRTNRTWEQPDSIGWKRGYSSILVEVKTSRSDFLVDSKKPHRFPGQGMGQIRYFLAPAGLIKPDELPKGWGLLEQRGERVRKVVPAAKPGLCKDKLYREIPLLIAQLERVNNGRPHHMLPVKGNPVIEFDDGPEPGDDYEI